MRTDHCHRTNTANHQERRESNAGLRQPLQNIAFKSSAVNVSPELSRAELAVQRNEFRVRLIRLYHVTQSH